MIGSTAIFKQLIKEDMRTIKARVTLHYAEDKILLNEDIQNIAICNNVNNILGGLQNDDITITVMPEVLTDEQFNRDIYVSVEIGIAGAEYIKIGKYMADGWKKNDSNKTITIDCSSYVTEDSECKQNIEHAGALSEYVRKVIEDNYNLNVNISETLIDHEVDRSWLCKSKLKEQLDTMVQGLQGIVRYVDGFEIAPFSHEGQMPCMTLKQGKNEAIMDTSRLTDYSKTKRMVKLLRTVFRETDNTKIASGSAESVNGTAETVVIKTTGPCNVLYVQLNNYYGQLIETVEGIDKIVLSVQAKYSEGSYTLPFNIVGTKVEQIQLDLKGNAPSTTYISNPYIQKNIASYDLSSLTGVKYKIMYRGNPCIQCGDILTIEGVGDIKVVKHSLTFNGGLTGIIEGVLAGE